MSDQLIDAIYDAPLSPSGWQSALLQIADAFGATDAALYASDSQGKRLKNAVSGRLPDEVHRMYFDQFAERDTQILRLLRLKEDQDITGLDLLDDEVAAPCPVHHEYLVPHRISSQIVWLLNGAGDRKYTLALMRAESDGAFDSSVRRKFGAMARHIKRSIRVHAGVKAVQEQSINDDIVLSKSEIGLALVEKNGELRATNDFAKSLLRQSSTLRQALQTEFGITSKVAWEDHATPIYQRNVFDPELRMQFEICLHRRSRSIENLFGPNERSGALCMIRPVEIDPAQRGALWQHRYGLTTTEVDLANHLLKGETLNSFAEERKRSVHTARNQLKSLLGKSGARSQVELVAVLRDTLAETGAGAYRT